MAAVGPGPLHGITHRDVDRIRHKLETISTSHRHRDNRAGRRWHAVHGWLAVLIENADGRRALCVRHTCALRPDSARTKIPIAKMAATQKINRAALDIFIMLVFFLRASVTNLFLHKPQLTLCGSVPGYCAAACEKGKQNIWPNKNVRSTGNQRLIFSELLTLRARSWSGTRPRRRSTPSFARRRCRCYCGRGCDCSRRCGSRRCCCCCCWRRRGRGRRRWGCWRCSQARQLRNTCVEQERLGSGDGSIV